jgi:hypothetical protein
MKTVRVLGLASMLAMDPAGVAFAAAGADPGGSGAATDETAGTRSSATTQADEASCSVYPGKGTLLTKVVLRLSLST